MKFLYLCALYKMLVQVPFLCLVAGKKNPELLQNEVSDENSRLNETRLGVISQNSQICYSIFVQMYVVRSCCIRTAFFADVIVEAIVGSFYSLPTKP